MKKKTFRYIILLNFSLLFFLPSFLIAQEEQSRQNQQTEKTTVPQITSIVKPKKEIYRGTSVNLDIYEAGSYLFGGDFLSTELGIEVNLKNRYFPTLEVGYGKTDATEDSYGMHYRSSAPYARIGLNYNTMAKSRSSSYLYVGLRYGFTAVNYDIYGPPMQDEVWLGELPFEYYGEKSHLHWGEFLVGVKANIYKNFSMGWAIRYKFRLDIKDNFNTSPWYLPGYGKNKSTNVGLTYNLIYQLPF